MRFIANENVAGNLIAGLRERGRDVMAVKETMRSAADAKVLETARAEQRVVLTHDKDSGELAVRARLPAECGVILLRLAGASPEEDVARALTAIESRTDWAGHFAVVAEQRVRMRPLAMRPEDEGR
ncbi:MAG: DUF5615 family PIN-like protein [Planctomycetota bacterium]